MDELTEDQEQVLKALGNSAWRKLEAANIPPGELIKAVEGLAKNPTTEAEKIEMARHHYGDETFESLVREKGLEAVLSHLILLHTQQNNDLLLKNLRRFAPDLEEMEVLGLVYSTLRRAEAI